MRYKITIEASDDQQYRNGTTIYEQRVEELDLTAVIVAVNKGASLLQSVKGLDL